MTGDDDPLASPPPARGSLDDAVAGLLKRRTPAAPMWPVADHPCTPDDVGPYEPCEACGALISVQTFTPDRGEQLGKTRTDRYEFVRRECDLPAGVHGLGVRASHPGALPSGPGVGRAQAHRTRRWVLGGRSVTRPGWAAVQASVFVVGSLALFVLWAVTREVAALAAGAGMLTPSAVWLAGVVGQLDRSPPAGEALSVHGEAEAADEAHRAVLGSWEQVARLSRHTAHGAVAGPPVVGWRDPAPRMPPSDSDREAPIGRLSDDGVTPSPERPPLLVPDRWQPMTFYDEENDRIQADYEQRRAAWERANFGDTG